MAALVNGTMVRYLDLNDAYRTLDASHPSDNLPGLLAVAEALGLSGRELILALFISYEIQCRFTDTVPFNDAGWDQPVVGAQAAALAAGRMMGLDAEALAHALSLAVVPHLCTYQTRSGELSMWKGCAGPNGARHGVFAAQLAREGMTGPYNAYEGMFGLWKQTLGKAGEFRLPAGKLAAPLGIEPGQHQEVPGARLVPAADRHRARAAPQARRRRRPRASRWTRTSRPTPARSPTRSSGRRKTRETADHSMPFSIAAALADGEVTSDTFEDHRFLDADVLGLIGAMKIEVNADFSRQTPGLRNCRIEAVLADGESVVAHCTLAQADIEKGTPDDVVNAKFHALTRRFLPADCARRPRRRGVAAGDAGARRPDHRPHAHLNAMNSPARDVQSDAARLLDTVTGGGVGIFPTDVGYAIIGNGEAAIARIFACKQRSFDKACGMFSNWDMFLALAAVGERERAIVDTVIHGHRLPFSVVTPYRMDHPFFAGLTPLTRERSSRGDTIDMLLNAGALHDEIARLAWVRATPVLGSSANQSLSGSKYKLADVEEAVRDEADLVIDYGDTKYSHPAGMGSSIIALPSLEPIRKGIKFDEICDIIARRFGTDPRGVA